MSRVPRTAWMSTSFLNGLVRNSSAPAFIACTDIGASPYPVMKIIGMSPRSASCFCSSRPLRPGSVTSSTRQLGTVVVSRKQKVLRRHEPFRRPACALDQKLERVAHRDVVVDDEDNRPDVWHGEDLTRAESDSPMLSIGRLYDACPSRRCHAYLARNAASSASSSAVSLNGLNRNSTAPCASRRARTLVSRLAVTKIIGICFWRRLRCC